MKIISIVLLVILSVYLIFSCFKPSDEPKEKQTSTSTIEDNLYVYNYFIDLAVNVEFDGNYLKNDPKNPMLVTKIFAGGIENLTNNDLKTLKRINTLDYIQLFGNHISDQGLINLVHFERIDEIDLDQVNITDEGLKILSKIRGLDEIVISNSVKISKDGLISFLNKSPTKTLRIINCKGISKSDMATLQTSFPNLKISNKSFLQELEKK